MEMSAFDSLAESPVFLAAAITFSISSWLGSASRKLPESRSASMAACDLLMCLISLKTACVVKYLPDEERNGIPA